MSQDPNSSAEMIRNIPLIPLRDLVIFPSTLVPFIIGRESSVQALDKALETGQAHLPGRPDGRLHEQPDAQGHLFPGRDRQSHPDGQVGRQERQGHRRGEEAGPGHRVSEHLSLLSGAGQGHQGDRGPEPRDQGPPEAGPGPVRGLSEAQPERQHRIDHPGAPRHHHRADHRYHLLAPLPSARGKAEPARDHQHPGKGPAAELSSGKRNTEDPFPAEAGGAQGRTARRPRAERKPGRTSFPPAPTSAGKKTSPTRSRSCARR